MAIGRGLVATAVFAGGLAVGTASAAWADLPTMKRQLHRDLDNAVWQTH